jgi:hypothetical protein
MLVRSSCEGVQERRRRSDEGDGLAGVRSVDGGSGRADRGWVCRGTALAKFLSAALSISRRSVRHGVGNGDKPGLAPEGETMKTSLLLLSAVLLAESTQNAHAQQGPQPSEGAAAFARLKTLAGEWQADTKQGQAHVSYELVAGGSALVERESIEGMPPMLTTYYLDGGRLLLTHYCMAGNQPRMQEQRFDPGAGEIDFAFLDATNLASPGAGHMHNAKIHLIDQNHLASEWEFYQDGKLKLKESAQYTRVQ